MKGMPKLPHEEVLQVNKILFPYGPVQSQLGDEELSVLWGHGGVHHSGYRITRGKTEKQKQDRQDNKKNEDDL
jgi:hypothetical protein